MTGAQNRSTAVMARRLEPHDSLDFFPTPPWATRALVERVLSPTDWLAKTAWDPCCGEGDMARPMREYFAEVHASDVHDYAAPFGAQAWRHHVHDFLLPFVPEFVPVTGVDWIFINPPFRLAEPFILRALSLARRGVAVFIRAGFLEGVGRYQRLWRPTPPTLTVQFAERVPLVKGRLDADASTATSHVWLVWRHDAPRQPMGWIPPGSRAALERPSDYPPRPVPNPEEPAAMPLFDGPDPYDEVPDAAA